MSEFFDESIVLLKHRLCWEYKEVAFLILNARQV